MRTSVSFPLALLLFLTGNAVADSSTTRLRVQVLNSNDRPLASQARVEVVSQTTGAAVAESTTDGQGAVEVTVPAGDTYRIRVSGSGIQPMTAEVVVARQEAVHLEYVRVKLKPASGAEDGQSVHKPDEALAKRARKAFDLGVKALKERNWAGAAGHFQTALRYDPKSDEAYHNLGIARQNAGNISGARQAYEAAIVRNASNGAAYRELGRVLELQKDWPAAEVTLAKALALLPDDAGVITMLAMAQLQQNKLLDAMMMAHRAHKLGLQPHAQAHLVLAQAYERNRQPVDAAIEYQFYLKEEPSGPIAEQVRIKLGAKHEELASSRK